MDITQKFQLNLEKAGVRKNDTVVLGVSGGIDSVVMLDLFLNSNVNLIVAHLNHGVRVEAANDEKFVQELADNNNLKYVSHKIKKPEKGNLEEEMRILRHEFLERTAAEKKADFIALAHNANDQAETIFLNILRGTGPAGLAGMKAVSGKVIRPLLNISREEIEQHAREKGLKWVEDFSNNDISYQRNYLRHRIMPMFAETNPSWLEAVNRLSHSQREIDEHLKAEAREHLDAKVTELNKLPKPVLYEVFGLKYEQAKGNRTDLTLKNLAELEKLIGKTAGTKKVELPGKITAVRTYETLDFEAENRYNLNSQAAPLKLQVGTNDFGSWQIEVSEGNGKSSKSEIYIEKDSLTDITVRSRKSGDNIETAYGHKKLQDLFVDAKINKDHRDLWPVVTLSEQIIWVPNLAVSKKLNQEKTGLKINAKENHES